MPRIASLRIPYYIGAIVDAVAAVALLAPADSPLRGLAFPGADPAQLAYGDGTRTAMPLMLGWTCLLLWAARRPIERRMVLLLTALPVVAGLMAVELLNLSLGYGDGSGTIVTLVLQAALCVVFVVGFRAAGRASGPERAGTP